jgi:hypothetical protein
VTSSKSAKFALARLCREARQSLDPKLDATAIEAAVMARVARSPKDSVVVPRRKTWKHFGPAAVLAIATTFALFAPHWLDRHARSTAVSTRGQLAEEPGMDGALLAIGQVVEARNRDLTIKHSGIATWRLRSPGRARVVETSPRITLALEHGHVDVEAVPQPQPEIFAIEVEQLRVAVHGTVFSVERRGDIAEVVVKQGTVRVGSNQQRGATQGQLLTAPSRASIDVRPEETEEPSRAAAVMAPAKHLPLASTQSTHPAAAATPPRPALEERPSIEEVERIWDAARREISDCFAAQTGGDPSLRVSFGTEVQLRLAPDGEVSIAAFVPPVPQNVRSCADQRVSLLRTAPTDLGTVVNRPTVLTR